MTSIDASTAIVAPAPRALSWSGRETMSAHAAVALFALLLAWHLLVLAGGAVTGRWGGSL